MPWVKLEDTSLFYVESGSPGGRPLLLLHAALQTAESMEPLRRRLGPAGLRMVSMDQRGHGFSPAGSAAWSVSQFADDAAATMTQLGLKLPLVVGYSMGGTVAIELARRGLVSAMVVMAARVQSGSADQRAFDPGVIRSQMPKWVPQLETKHTATPWEELALRVGEMFTAFLGFTAAEMSAIECPMLVVQGDRDQMVPLAQAELLAGTVPGAQLAVVHHAGHPELLYRLEALQAVEVFLRQHLESRSASEIDPRGTVSLSVSVDKLRRDWQGTMLAKTKRGDH